MGKPVTIEVTRTYTVYSCVNHEQCVAGCPWCWALNQVLSPPPKMR
jgi:hypothetical protein